MRAQDLIDAIGRQADSDVVRNLLLQIGIDRRIAIRRDETDTYENDAKAGVSLLFESEDYISERHGVEFPGDAPVLTAIFLYGPGDDEFSEYSGDLPGGLLFSDSREEAAKKLGNSAKFNADRNSEFWELPGNLRLFVRYADGTKSIEKIQFGIVWR